MRFPDAPTFDQQMQSFQKTAQHGNSFSREVVRFADSCDEKAVSPPWARDKIASVAIGTALAVVRGAMASP